MMRCAIIAAALLLPSPLLAQGVSDSDKLKAARELMQASDVQGQLKAMGPRMAESMGTQIRQMFADGNMPEGLKTDLTAALQAHVGSMDTIYTPEVIDSMASIYAKHFTVEELQRITALTRDPVMLRFRDVLPVIMADMMPMILEAIKPRQQQFQAKIQQIIADWVRQHPEDKAKLRSPTAS